MLNKKEMYPMMKLRNKRKDREAQEKFHTWYNALSPEDKQRFDKFCRKNMYISIAVVVIIFSLIGSCMFGGKKDTATDTSSNAKQDEKAQNKNQSAGAGLYTVEAHIQKVYKNIAQSAGTGFPQIDCSFSKHWQNDVMGLTYMKGEYKLSTDKAIHTYTARYGSNTQDLTYLSLDGQRVYWNEDKEISYSNKYAEEHPEKSEK